MKKATAQIYVKGFTVGWFLVQHITDFGNDPEPIFKIRNFFFFYLIIALTDTNRGVGPWQMYVFPECSYFYFKDCFEQHIWKQTQVGTNSVDIFNAEHGNQLMNDNYFLLQLSFFNVYCATNIVRSLFIAIRREVITQKSNMYWYDRKESWGVTLSPPTSEAGVRFPARPQVGKLVSCLPLVGSLQYRTLTNCMYWFLPLPFQLPVVIWPVQCWKGRITPNKHKESCDQGIINDF